MEKNIIQHSWYKILPYFIQQFLIWILKPYVLFSARFSLSSQLTSLSLLFISSRYVLMVLSHI